MHGFSSPILVEPENYQGGLAWQEVKIVLLICINSDLTCSVKVKNQAIRHP